MHSPTQCNTNIQRHTGTNTEFTSLPQLREEAAHSKQ